MQVSGTILLHLVRALYNRFLSSMTTTPPVRQTYGNARKLDSSLHDDAFCPCMTLRSVGGVAVGAWDVVVECRAGSGCILTMYVLHV